MDFETIHRLAEYLPNNSPLFQRWSADELAEDISFESSRADEIRRYITCYKNMQFGWAFVRQLITLDLPLPEISTAEEPIYRAYLFEKHRHPDKELFEAVCLFHPAMRAQARVLNALLRDQQVVYKTIADRLGLKVEVVYLYEQLFYNVVDRRAEALFIATLNYPQTRAVENSDTYTRDVSVEDLLGRAAYNRGIDDAMYFVGLPRNPYAGRTVPETSQALESQFLANGLFFAMNGYLNQEHGTAGLRAAKSLLSAAKMGGQEQSAVPVYDFGNISDVLLRQMTTMRQAWRPAALYERWNKELPRDEDPHPFTPSFIRLRMAA